MKKLTRMALGSITGAVVGTALLPLQVGISLCPPSWPVINGVQGALIGYQIGEEPRWAAFGGAVGFTFGTGMALASPVLTPAFLLSNMATPALFAGLGAIIAGDMK